MDNIKIWKGLETLLRMIGKIEIWNQAVTIQPITNCPFFVKYIAYHPPPSSREAFPNLSKLAASIWGGGKEWFCVRGRCTSGAVSADACTNVVCMHQPATCVAWLQIAHGPVVGYGPRLVTPALKFRGCFLCRLKRKYNFLRISTEAM